MSLFLNDACTKLINFKELVPVTTLDIYMRFLPLMKEESAFAQHYAARFDGLTQVTGDKP